MKVAIIFPPLLVRLPVPTHVDHPLGGPGPGAVGELKGIGGVGGAAGEFGEARAGEGGGIGGEERG
jgi:hypothetical protein